VGDRVLAHQRLDRSRVRGIDLGGGEPVVGASLGRQRVDRLTGPCLVVVRDDAQLEEVATGGDGGERRADTARADEKDAHGCAHSPKYDMTCLMRV
jgi:hypothetical protein